MNQNNMRNNNNRRNRNNHRNNNNRNNNRNSGMNDARARGNAQQLLEKYKNLARDASQAGDRVLAEYYMQHADHYFRVVAEFRARYEEQRQQEMAARGIEDNDANAPEMDEVEGVDSVDLNRPTGFAPAVAVQSYGADAPAAAQNDDAGNSGNRAETSETQATSEADAEPASDASDDADDARSRNRRGRMRRRPRENADAAEPVEG